MLSKNKLFALFSATAIASLSFAVHAQETTNTHVIIAPHCLLQHVHAQYKTLSSNPTLALIEINNANIDQLIEAKNQRSAIPCGGFMDVTVDWQIFNKKNIAKPNAKSFLEKYTNPSKALRATSLSSYGIQYEEQVNTALKLINPQNIWTNLTTLSSFPDRYLDSDNGVKAVAWIKQQVEQMAQETGHTDDVSVYYVASGSYKQPSVIAKLGKSDEAGIVIGGHIDTLSGRLGPKPGADDDGSGSATVLEVARTIFSSGLHFKKPIYFIWYAGEERGLVGSGYVVKDFKNKNRPVDAVLQFDMTGYAYKNDPTMWLVKDYTDNNLTAYLATLINTYVKQPVQYTQCGYACSDHASWEKEGYPAAFPFEAKFGQYDPYIHTGQDKMDILSLTHITDYTKLGTAFAIELAEPTA